MKKINPPCRRCCPRGDLTGRRARGNYRLEETRILFGGPKLSRAEAAGKKMVTGSRRRQHEQGGNKTRWEVKGKARTWWNFFGEKLGVPQSWLGVPNPGWVPLLSWGRKDERMEPVAFGVNPAGCCCAVLWIELEGKGKGD